MPVVGSNTQNYGTMGEIPNLPEKYQSAARYGIHFIELRHRKPITMDVSVYGPLDVRVGEQYNTMYQRTDYKVKWLKENEAHIRYSDIGRGVGVAWVPDDKYWRNRIYIMDTPLLYSTIFGYHTKNGQYPGSMFKLEIDCLREVLKDVKTIYRVLENGREIVFYHKESEAREFVNEHTQVRHHMDTLTGEVKTKTSKKKYEIVPGQILGYKDEIADLIRRENNKHTFGWTESEEFQQKIKPQVIKLIEERQNEKETPVDDKDKILSVLRSLSREEREQLLSSAKSPTLEGSSHDDGDVEPPEGPGVDFDPWEVRPISHYRKMNKAELEKIYSGRGNNPEGKTFVQLVDELVGQDKDNKAPEGEVIT